LVAFEGTTCPRRDLVIAARSAS
jgi:Domain of unknown function (DUF3597)/CreA protein